MPDFHFAFDPHVEVLPGLKYDVHEELLADVICDAIDQHYLHVDEVIREQKGFSFPLTQPDAQMMVDSIHGFTINGGEPQYLYLVSCTTEIRGHYARWKTFAMNKAEWQANVNRARQSPPTFLI